MTWLEDLYYVLYALAAACGVALICIVILVFCGVITCSAGAGFFAISVHFDYSSVISLIFILF